MKTACRIFCCILVMSFAFFCFSAGVSAATFRDLQPDNACYSSVEKLVEEGSIRGYPDGTFRAESSITRAELVTIINRVFDYQEMASGCSFSDVKKGSWYYESILQAVKVGYAKGYPNGTFLPDGNVTKEESCAFINRQVNLPQQHRQHYIPINNKLTEWAKLDVQKMIWNGVWSTDANGYFFGNMPATRGEVCIALAQFASNTPPVDQKVKMFNVLLSLNKNVLPLCNEGQKNVVLQITDSMQKYIFDTRYDYRGAAEKAMDDYASLSSTDRRQLENWIGSYNTLSEVRDLAWFFFPEMQF